MTARIKIDSPPAAEIDWVAFANDVKVQGRITKPIHIKEEFGFSQSTVMAVWKGEPIGTLPYLRICKRLKLSATQYLMER